MTPSPALCPPRLLAPRRRLLTLALCAGLAAELLSNAALAQGNGWPQQPVRVIVPFAPGGPTDALARQLSVQLSRIMGQPFVVDNRAGAQGVIGTVAVKDAKPDGYTLLFHEITATFAIQPAIAKNAPYDGTKDFTPISPVASGPIFLIVNTAVPVQTAKQLVELSKNTKGGLSFASSGAMGQMPTHLGPELFKLRHGVDARVIVYKGGAPAMLDTAAGRIDFMMVTGLVAARPFLDTDKVRAIAVTGKSRSPNMPNVPTFQEAGVPLPELDRGVMFGLLGPAGLPADIVARLADGVNQALATSEMQTNLSAQDLVPAETRGPQALRDIMRSDIAVFTPVVKQLKLSEQ